MTSKIVQGLPWAVLRLFLGRWCARERLAPSAVLEPIHAGGSLSNYQYQSSWTCKVSLAQRTVRVALKHRVRDAILAASLSDC